jgi:T-complex protein 1 subunit alpha
LCYASQAQSEPAAHGDKRWSGLDLANGTLRNSLDAGVIEPAMAKVKCLQLATEAAITILRIDDTIKLKPKQGEQTEEDDGHGH